MEKLKNLLRPSLVVLSFAAPFAALAGCGGHTASAPSSAAAAAPGPGATPTPTNPNSKTIPDIQKLSGWETCSSSCAGTPSAVFSMTQGITSPALSGASDRFQLLSGTQPFGGVLWFKFLGAQNSATHFVYDLNFYMDNPAAAQALEFNVSQSVGGSRYSFSTQCDLAGGHMWRVWDPVAFKWVASTATCAAPAANTWNHLIWEFERDSSGHTVFTAVTLNGSRAMVNMSMGHTGDSSSGVDVAFQLDANSAATPYSAWLDKINLTFW
jgi:hypothetical protein